METSTPMPSELRRRTLLNNANTASPLRKSLNISVLNNSIIEDSNDDAERADRRSQFQLQKRLSSISTPKSVNLSETFINEQFMMYTHLYTENKITVKNAWKLQIIDMLKPLCQKHGQDVLQVASTSIDISTKVYGIRVDDLHSETLKLASNMARVSDDAAPGDDGAESAEEQDGGVPSEKAKKKKKKKVNLGVKTTIAKNPRSNLGKLPKLEPTDFTTRVNADTGTIDNLFSNILKESSSSFILLDASQKFLETSDSIVKNDERIPLKYVSLPRKNCSLNAPLHDFIVDQWDPEQEKNLLNPDKSVLSQIQPVVFDDNGFPIPELDGSVHDCFENNDADVEIDNDHDDDHVGEIRNAEHAVTCSTITHIVDLRPTESTMRSSEYTFNSTIANSNGKYIDQIWAGPSHWKLKCLRRSIPRFSGQTVQEKQKKQKKIPEMIDFFGEPVIVDFTKKITSKKRPSIAIDKITLPLMDQSCATTMQNIKELILKPGVCPVEKADKPVTDTDEFEVNPYNYENENDSLYCSQSQPNENLEADDHVDDEECANQDIGNLAEHLVDNPEMVPNTYIHYAQTSKQVDMKKLKKAIWTKLTNGKSADSEDQKNAAKVNPQNFSDMFQALPDLLGKNEKQKVSCPLAFVALLHLANEQNLELKQLPGYKDCQIMGPTDINSD